MSILSSIREVHPAEGSVVIQDEEGNTLTPFEIAEHSYQSQLDVLKKAYDDQDQLIEQFDENDKQLQLQIQACEVTLSKGEDISVADKKQSLVEQRDKSEKAFLVKASKLAKGIEKVSTDVITAHHRYVDEAANLIAKADAEGQNKVEQVMNDWKSGKLESTNHKQAIAIALEEAGLIKGKGEGSKGGKIIGHTKSGKPIYDSFNHPSHKNFTKQDHESAMRKHESRQDRELPKSIGYDEKGKTIYSKSTPESDARFQHHRKQWEAHDKASRKAHNEDDDKNPKERLKQLVSARKRDPEDQDHHDNLHDHIKKHYGKAAAHHFSETFNPGEHGMKDAHEILHEATNGKYKKAEDNDLSKAEDYLNHFVAIIYRDSQGRILLMQRNDNSKQWMLPGGHIDAGEIPLQAAVREFKEECNLALNPASIWFTSEKSVQDGKCIYYYSAGGYDVQDKGAHGPLANIDSQDEAIQFKFMSVDEWIAADLFKDTKDHLKDMLLPKTEKLNKAEYEIELQKAITLIQQAVSDGFIERDKILK